MISWGFRKRQKYGAKARQEGGEHFDSTGEWRRWLELKLMEKAGLISGLSRQARYRLEVNGVHVCDYVADFVYTEMPEPPRLGFWPKPEYHAGIVVEDFKSPATMTPIFAIKRKLMLACHGIEIRVTGKGVKQATEPATVRAAGKIA